ncbi:MAG: hypothetical protein KME07_16835 [Pegethrix bostrychoides GSE-TBD4-15B]|jgi:hypothetical protein|uniref:Uncharacterized protein n=1 Tax=Pegethrix bostrychoides GSE-TBD4-15B TaxID=2839662 RepID=A0A951PCZ9_9CYAN|nr:hypothetical protein [Pegethrix bostrychoides GSE-TBD4-15B]
MSKSKSKLFQLSLALGATFGILSTAMPRPAMAAEPNAAGDSTHAAQTIAGLAIVGAGAGVIAYSAKRAYLPQSAKQSSGQSSGQVNSRLQKKLLRQLHNDRNAAHRLLTHVQQTHPDRSPNWVIEKVIYDLERDRNRH